MNCQTVRPPTKEGQADVVRCEFCKEPPRIAFIACTNPNIPEELDKHKTGFMPICGGEYLFIDVIPAPDWCPLKKEVV
jgi:hypothetical protein